MKPAKHILPTIVISQFCCTSLWFASNGVMPNLAVTFNLNGSALSHLTSCVQFGFIIGTLCYASLTLADRFSPSRVFFISAALGALFNLGLLWQGNSLMSILAFRFLTGFFLAGIYPIGMKIAADYYNQGLGKSLGFLVGALVLGTASPHLFKNTVQNVSWELVIVFVSCLALFGGLLMAVLVPNGPFRTTGQRVKFTAFISVFKNKTFCTSALGYFGHMWELYAFWTFVPLIIRSFKHSHPASELIGSLWSFLIIGIGSLSCVFGGYVSQKLGTKTTAYSALLLSGLCCLVSPLILSTTNATLFCGFLMFWGMMVIADSPLFSTLVAQNADPKLKGTALTTINCIGFAITIVSIQVLNWLHELTNSNCIYLVLALGPFFGLLSRFKK